DDKETALSGGIFGSNFGMFPRISDDRSMAILEVQGNRPPAPGATRVRLKGTLVLSCGSEEKTSEHKGFEPKANATVTVGGFEVKVTKEKGYAGGAEFSVEGKSPCIKSVSAVDADGKAVEVAHMGWSGGGSKLINYYALKRQADKVTLKITWFSRAEQL